VLRADNVVTVITVYKSVSLILPELSGSVQACTGNALPSITLVRKFRLTLTLNEILKLDTLTNKVSTHKNQKL
jgi:hypothetical protein